MNRNATLFFFLCLLWWLIAIVIKIFIPEETISRTINGYHTDTLDIIMQLLTRGGEWLFITLFLLVSLIIFKRKEINLALILAILIAILLPTVVTNLVKGYVHAPRPLTVFRGEEWLYMIPGYKNNYEFSFPSGHTTGAFACFTITSFLSNKKSIIYPIVFIIIAVLVGISRIYLLQHFWEDILWGSIIGFACSRLVLYIYEKKIQKKNKLNTRKNRI